MPPLVVQKLKKWFVIALLLVGACTPYQLPSSPFDSVRALYNTKGHGSTNKGLIGQEDDATYEDKSASQVIRYYIEKAVERMGTPDGHYALEYLNELTSQRKSYNFTTSSINENNSGCSSTISAIPQLLPPSMLEELLRQSKDMERFMNTNLDSVDGIPSIHLNLWVRGKERFANDENVDKMEEYPTGYKNGIQKLLKLLKPYLCQVLLPHVQTLMNDSSIMIDEVFLRRYGDDVGRRSISAHFDCYSRVTAVIALDDVACNGNNGLYTTTTRTSPVEQPCNHVALRRYFPLRKGDGVVHSWDVLHGVDVEPGLVRTSLIVWFVSPYPTHKINHIQKSSKTLPSTTLWNRAQSISEPAPWVSQRFDLAINDVAQFVLASILEASPSLDDHDDDISISYELYLKSAALGNAFALDRLGWMFYEDKGGISSTQAISAKFVAEKLHSSSNLIASLHLEDHSDDKSIPCILSLAKRFWYEGAIRGVAQSQLALAYHLKKEAEEMMMKKTQLTSEELPDNDEDEGQKLRLMAAVFASLAEQQGEEDAATYLTDLVNQEIVARSIKTDIEFTLSPVVQTITAWKNIL